MLGLKLCLLGVKQTKLPVKGFVLMADFEECLNRTRLQIWIFNMKTNSLLSHRDNHIIGYHNNTSSKPKKNKNSFTFTFFFNQTFHFHKLPKLKGQVHSVSNES